MLLSNNKIIGKDYSAIILAGGNSSRMGYPKPWLKDDDGLYYLQRIINTYKKCGIEDIVVVLNKKFAIGNWETQVKSVNEDAVVVLNSTPEKGRLYSLQLGLQQAQNDLVFIHNTDNPFVKSETIYQLISASKNNAITNPLFGNKGGHPVVINTEVKKEIIKNFHYYNTLKEVFNEFNTVYIKVNDEHVLKNINTPEEYEAMKHELV